MKQKLAIFRFVITRTNITDFFGTTTRFSSDVSLGGLLKTVFAFFGQFWGLFGVVVHTPNM